jgi:hypothetical protein
MHFTNLISINTASVCNAYGKRLRRGDIAGEDDVGNGEAASMTEA